MKQLSRQLEGNHVFSITVSSFCCAARWSKKEPFVDASILLCLYRLSLNLFTTKLDLIIITKHGADLI